MIPNIHKNIKWSDSDHNQTTKDEKQQTINENSKKLSVVVIGIARNLISNNDNTDYD